MCTHMGDEEVEGSGVPGSPQQRMSVPRESRFNESHSHKIVVRHNEGRKDPGGVGPEQV